MRPSELFPAAAVGVGMPSPVESRAISFDAFVNAKEEEHMQIQLNAVNDQLQGLGIGGDQGPVG